MNLWARQRGRKEAFDQNNFLAGEQKAKEANRRDGGGGWTSRQGKVKTRQDKVKERLSRRERTGDEASLLLYRKADEDGQE